MLKRRLIILLILVLVFGITFSILIFKKSKESRSFDSKVIYSLELPKLSADSESKIPQGFPREFIIGKNPEVTNGEIAHSTEGQLKMHLTFQSGSSRPELVHSYQEYAQKANWNIISNTYTDSSNHLALESVTGNRKVILDMFKMEEATVVIRYYAKLAQ